MLTTLRPVSPQQPSYRNDMEVVSNQWVELLPQCTVALVSRNEHSSVPTAYNAIWKPDEGSVTRFLQCRGCVSQSPTLSAAVIAAEIQYPRDMAQDQVHPTNDQINIYSICTGGKKRKLISKLSFGIMSSRPLYLHTEKDK